MNKKKIIGLAGAVVVCILVFVFIVIRGKSPNPAENPEEMLGRIENALGDEYKKQSMTELVATLKYGDEEGNEINYYILKTTYYEADPAEITGLNTEAIKRIVNPDRADSCQKMKIQDWDAALYERGELSYLCWTYSPEVSYILEYSPYAFADEEIIKMAESAKPINEECAAFPVRFCRQSRNCEVPFADRPGAMPSAATNLQE